MTWNLLIKNQFSRLIQILLCVRHTETEQFVIGEKEKSKQEDYYAPVSLLWENAVMQIHEIVCKL